METFDNTRPLVAAMAVGVTRAALEETRKQLKAAGVKIDYDVPANNQHAAAARFLEMEADYEAAWLLTLQAAWMADNSKPNSLRASMAKAKAGRTCVDVTLGWPGMGHQAVPAGLRGATHVSAGTSRSEHLKYGDLLTWLRQWKEEH